MKNLQKSSLTCLTLQRQVEIGFVERIKDCTEDRLNQEAERDTRRRKWLLCRRYILRSGQNSNQNLPQAKWLHPSRAVVKEEIAAVMNLIWRLFLKNVQRSANISQRKLQPNWYPSSLCQPEKHQVSFKVYQKKG